MPTLLIMKGAAADKCVRLPGVGGRLVVGRGRGSDVVLHDDALVVSRRHAEISASATGFTVIDLGSRNGVWRRGTRIAAAALDAVDPIVIGQYHLLLAGDDATGSSSLEANATADDPAAGVPGLPRPSGSDAAMLITFGVLAGLVIGGLVVWLLLSVWSRPSATHTSEGDDRITAAVPAPDTTVLAGGAHSRPSPGGRKDSA